MVGGDGWSSSFAARISCCWFAPRFIASEYDGLEQPDRGHGVNWEAGLIQQELYENNRTNRRFIPVLPLGKPESCIPVLLRDFPQYRLPDEFDGLYRHVTGQPEVVPAPLGPLQIMPPRSEGAVESPATPAIKNDAANPFDPWLPAAAEKFVGRAESLLRLQTALDAGHSVNLVGDWRIGKTSLLRAWAERARNGGREVRSLSGEGPEGGSVAAFVAAITGHAAERDADTAADQLAAWAGNVGRAGLEPLVLIDEFDGLLSRIEHRFWERLRGMLDRVRLVLVTRREIDLIYTEAGRTSPFYNRLETQWIGLLEPPAAESLIARVGFLSASSADHANLLRHWCGRHPFYLQLLGWHLFRVRVAGGTVETALDEFAADAIGRLRDLGRTLSDRERSSLMAAANGQPINVRSLRTRGLVTEDNQLFGHVLAAWLHEEL